jgi:hypothetical protein
MDWGIAFLIGTIVVGGATVALLLWRRDIENGTEEKMENATNKKALDDQRKISDAQEKVREEWDSVRDHTSNDWDDFKRMRP